MLWALSFAVRKGWSREKVGFQISGVSSIYVHVTLDPGTFTEAALWYLSISEMHRIGQVCAERKG